jgi:hypothetical protein
MKVKLPISWIEVAVLVCILLIVARFIWARELLEIENSLFHAFGISENWKYIFTLPLAFFVYLSIFQEQKAKANNSGNAVVRKPILIGAALIFFAVILYLVIWV